MSRRAIQRQKPPLIKTPVTFLAGPPGSGKSLLLEIIRMTALTGAKPLDYGSAYPCFDMSSVIEWFRAQPDHYLGKIFRDLSADQKQCKLLPDQPILDAGMKYIQHMGESRIIHCLFAGGIRNRQQAEMALEVYGPYRLTYISATIEESIHGILNRPDMRDDAADMSLIMERIEKANAAEAEMCTYLANMGITISLIKRKDKALIKAMILIGLMSIPGNVKMSWLTAVQDPKTDVGAYIAWLDSGKLGARPQPGPTESALPILSTMETYRAEAAPAFSI